MNACRPRYVAITAVASISTTHSGRAKAGDYNAGGTRKNAFQMFAHFPIYRLAVTHIG